MRNSRKVFAAVISVILIMFSAGCGDSKGNSNDAAKNDATSEMTTEETTTEETSAEETTEDESVTEEETAEETTAQQQTVSPQVNNQTPSREELKVEPKPGSSAVTMSFTGDVYFSDRLWGHYTQSGLTGFLSQSLVDRFKNVDLMMANHEYAATDLSDEYRDDFQLFNFKASPVREKIWSELGVDIVTLANNHIRDFGEQSMLDTFEALKANNVSYVGAGYNQSEALKAEIREINGKKIAVMGSCRFVPTIDWYATDTRPGLMATYETTPQYKMILNEITRLKVVEKCDAVVVMIHFGTEGTNVPDQWQPVVAHGYIDAGADAVIGSHAHRLQGVEIYQGAPIFYNLGNFLFQDYYVDTAVANLVINADNTVSASITPCRSQLYKTEEAVGDEAQRILKYIESISVNVKIDEHGNITQK